MMADKKKKEKRPMSLTKKILLAVFGTALVIGVVYFTYYYVHYMAYDKYEDYLTAYEYEAGTPFKPLTEESTDVAGMELVAENEYLKLYTDTKTAYIAVYDKRDGSITYSNPLDADEDTVAKSSNINYLKSQFILEYYNKNSIKGTYDSYSQSVAKGQFQAESIGNGIRYLYKIGDTAGDNCFDVPLEYRLNEDGLEVSVPVSGIKEYGNLFVSGIQLLRYMGAADMEESGYMVVPNGSGSLIYFNNGKLTAPIYTQYIYDIDPMVATYTTTENIIGAKLPLFGICREDRSLLVTVEDGATTAAINAGISGVYNEYNYAYASFVLRNTDNLRMFGNSTTDIYVMEPDMYDINCKVRYTFLNDEYKGYAGMANYYRNRLINEGVLTQNSEDGDIPFYYDVIAGVKETSHFLGVQYLHTFVMTDFEQAGEMSNALNEAGINNQVMNLQGWFNGGYYHDTPDTVKVPLKLGGKSDLEDLNETLSSNGGRLYVDVAIQQVTFADDEFNYNAEGARYYGAGYVASFGQINPTTLRNTSGLGYYETKYNLLSPKFLPRYAQKFAKKISNYDVSGISLRDLGNVVFSDKKRTELISREEALDVVLGQFDVLQETGKNLMTNAANSYSFAYSDDIINVPVYSTEFYIVDESIPLYEMIIHGCIDYSSELLNYEDAEDMTPVILKLIETGAAPHYAFTWEESSKMKDTGLSHYYATTFDTWSAEAVSVYEQVNEALKHVSGSVMTDHQIFDNGVRKISYDNGVVIYINYAEEAQTADGVTIPALSYRMEGM